jgi:hypothetical protein
MAAAQRAGLPLSERGRGADDYAAHALNRRQLLIELGRTVLLKLGAKAVWWRPARSGELSPYAVSPVVGRPVPGMPRRRSATAAAVTCWRL